ncbi:hypothetical protein SRHO_G00300800 [Serrasalmus rhombeus]
MSVREAEEEGERECSLLPPALHSEKEGGRQQRCVLRSRENSDKRSGGEGTAEKEEREIRLHAGMDPFVSYFFLYAHSVKLFN